MSTVIRDMRDIAGSSYALGMVTAFLGLIAIVAPLFSGITVTVLVGMLMAAAGIAATYYAFQAPSFGKGVLRFLSGGVAVVFGLLLIISPVEGLKALTILLALFFLIEGITNVMLALRVRPEQGWGWLLFSGIVSLLFTVLVFARWPLPGDWAVGVFTGVWMLSVGLTMTAFGAAGKAGITDLQDARIAELERNQYQIAVALGNLQADLAAIQTTLETRVAKSDVDPTIADLNAALSEARTRMQEFSQETDEAVQARKHQLKDLIKAIQSAVQ